LETGTPKGHKGAIGHNKELGSAVRQGAGILAEAVPARAGRSTTEKMKENERFAWGRRKSVMQFQLNDSMQGERI